MFKVIYFQSERAAEPSAGEFSVRNNTRRNMGGRKRVCETGEMGRGRRDGEG